MAVDHRPDQSAAEYGDARPEEQLTVLDFSGDFLRQLQQAEDGSDSGSTERHGTLEPDDSRNVTGAAGGGVGAPGGADQQDGGERWGGQQAQGQGEQSQRQSGQAFTAEEAARGQPTQFDPGARQPDEGGGSDRPQDQQSVTASGQIRPHMEVIGADGVHLGTVDRVEGHRIKLTRADGGMGAHQGHHHYISCGLVAGVEGDRVRLSATAANAYALEEET